MTQALTRPLTQRVPRLLTRPLPNRLNPNEYHDGISLDFRRNRFYVKAPGRPARAAPFTSLFAFTGDNQSLYRGANGILIPSATNTPRIEYDALGNVLGLLIEGSRTNLGLQSQDLTAAEWTLATAQRTANAATAPDNTLTADKLFDDATAASAHRIRPTSDITITSGGTYSVSIWAKAAERARLNIRFANVGETDYCEGRYNLSTGVVVAANTAGVATGAAAQIEAFTNGWYRCTISGAINGGSVAARIRIGLEDSGGNLTYNGDNSSGLFLWGFQVEAGAFRSSYIPTTTTSVTRAVELASRTVGSEVAAAVASLFAEWDVIGLAASVGQAVASVDFNDNDVIALLQARNPGGGTINSFVLRAGAAEAQIGHGSSVSGTMLKQMLAVTTNDAQAALSGALGTADTSVTLGTAPTTMRLGAYGSSNQQPLFGHIRRLDYWPERLTNDNLQRLTA